MRVREAVTGIAGSLTSGIGGCTGILRRLHGSFGGEESEVFFAEIKGRVNAQWLESMKTIS